MKKIGLSIVFFILGFPISSQIPVFLAGITDPITMQWRVQNAANWATHLENTIRQIRYAHQPLENQLRALEALGEGDWDALVKYLEYQAKTFESFNQAVEGMEFLKEVGDLGKFLEDDKWENFREQAQKISGTVRSLASSMHTTDELIKSTQMRVEHGRYPLCF